MNLYFKRYLILVILGLSAILVYSLLPPLHYTQQIWPGTNVQYIQTYYNQGDSASSFRLQSSGDSIFWSGTLNAPRKEDAWATLQFDLQNLPDRISNWTHMDTLILKLQSFGTPELMFKVLTWDPDFSKSGDPSTYRVLTKEFDINAPEQRLTIPIEHLYVPEWWYKQNNIPTRYDAKHLESVRYLEISTTARTPRNREIRLVITQVAISGHKRTYQVILFVFLFILALVAIGIKPPQGTLDS